MIDLLEKEIEDIDIEVVRKVKRLYWLCVDLGMDVLYRD